MELTWCIDYLAIDKVNGNIAELTYLFLIFSCSFIIFTLSFLIKIALLWTKISTFARYFARKFYYVTDSNEKLQLYEQIQEICVIKRGAYNMHGTCPDLRQYSDHQRLVFQFVEY